jgi:limonene 1,2-monooxygenase
MTQRLGFGAFLPPFHPPSEHPTLQLEADLELAEYLDELGFDELWVGEHHSVGWELVGSPEMFLAAAAQRTQRIRLGTGVVSIPYHHPFNVAQRIALLDHLSRGRAMLGVGPGALPSDAYMLGIESTTQRARMEEGLGVILRLLYEDEPVTCKSDWFTLQEAALQLRPFQQRLPVAVASQISPAGMQTAGKFGTGVLSIGSYSEQGLRALPTQWQIGQTVAAEHGQHIDRANWRITVPFHLADSKEQAYREAGEGLKNWHNNYYIELLGRTDVQPFSDGLEAATAMDSSGAVIGTPDDAVDRIIKLQQLSGGFGTVLAFGHCWTTREQTLRTYDLLARYVMPRVQGLLGPVQRTMKWVAERKETLSQNTVTAVRKAIHDYNATHPRKS